MKRLSNKNANSSYRRTNNNNYYRSTSSSFKSAGKFNMLNALTAFCDTNFRRSPDQIKFRAVLKNTVIKDDEGNEYSQEEAAQLLAAALLEGRGINFYLFQNEDGSYGGNGRINILELESASASSSKSKPKASKPSKPTATKAKVTKRNYEQLVEEDEEQDDEDDDNGFIDDTDIDNLDEDELNQLIDAF
jgi:hypothetical protein